MKAFVVASAILAQRIRTIRTPVAPTTRAHDQVSRGFRALWISVSLVLWLFFIWMASHRSDDPHILHRYSSGYGLLLAVLLGVTLAATALNLPKWIRRLYQLRWAMLLSVGSLAIAFGALEAFMRAIDIFGVSYYDESARYQLEKLPDSLLIFKHRSSWQARYHGVDVRLNELGLRTSPIAPKRDREVRVLALGDSVTFGIGVAEKDLFSTQVEERLAATLDRPVRVINAGVGGYNTVQEYRYFERDGIALSPDVVILTYVENDIEANVGPFAPWEEVSLKGKSPPQVLRRLAWNSWVYKLVTHVTRYGGLRSDKEPSTETLKKTHGWKDSMEALGKIAAICRERNLLFKVFYFRWGSTGHSETLLEEVRRAVFPFETEDTMPWFAGLNVKELLNSQIDSHPNREGHHILALHMAASLDTYLRRELLHKTGPH